MANKIRTKIKQINKVKIDNKKRRIDYYYLSWSVCKGLFKF